MILRSKSGPLFDPKHFRPISATGMRELDRRAIENFHMPTLLLMENAGRAVALAVCRTSALKKNPKAPVIVFCGGGNNGGDGFAAARYLSNWGHTVKLLLDRAPGRLQGDALVQWNAAKSLKIPFHIFHSREKLVQFVKQWPAAAVDALLGTGFKGKPKPPLPMIFEQVNRAKKLVVAADVPSGLDADEGLASDGSAIRADVTVTLGAMKQSFLKKEASDWTGKVTVAEIGFPKALIEAHSTPFINQQQ